MVDLEAVYEYSTVLLSEEMAVSYGHGDMSTVVG